MRIFRRIDVLMVLAMYRHPRNCRARQPDGGAESSEYPKRRAGLKTSVRKQTVISHRHPHAAVQKVNADGDNPLPPLTIEREQHESGVCNKLKEEKRFRSMSHEGYAYLAKVDGDRGLCKALCAPSQANDSRTASRLCYSIAWSKDGR